MGRETYLGDGLYASFDGMSDIIKLRAPRIRGNHEVYLEPAVFIELLKFAGTCWKVDDEVLQCLTRNPRTT